MPTCKIVSYPGLVTYAEALAEQYRLVDALLAGDGVDTMLLLEHTPTITVGRGSVPSDLLRTREALQADGIDVVDTDRGGEITYHGPGQLVAYPILNLDTRGRDLHAYLRNLEETIIRTIARFGIDGKRDPGFTGVWVDADPLSLEWRGVGGEGSRKIAAIGIKARRWVTMHGIALNVDADLTPFRRDFVPCGIHDRGVTSIAQELSAKNGSIQVKRSDVERVFSEEFLAVFAFDPESPVVFPM